MTTATLSPEEIEAREAEDIFTLEEGDYRIDLIRRYKELQSQTSELRSEMETIKEVLKEDAKSEGYKELMYNNKRAVLIAKAKSRSVNYARFYADFREIYDVLVSTTESEKITFSAVKD